MWQMLSRREDEMEEEEDFAAALEAAEVTDAASLLGLRAWLMT